MSENKTKIVSVSLSPEMHDLVKETSKKLGHKNVSLLFRELISKYINLLLDENDETAVMIKIPNDLIKNKDSLRNWLSVKVDAIVNALSK
jgi:hypothetical protein